MAKRKQMTTEAIIDSEEEFYKELEEKAKSPAKRGTNGPETKNGIITNSSIVNLRSEPSLDRNNVIELKRDGDKVKILDKIGDFYKVTTSVNKIAYVFSHFIKEE